MVQEENSTLLIQIRSHVAADPRDVDKNAFYFRIARLPYAVPREPSENNIQITPHRCY